jgi:hypothetical protein
MPKTRIGKWSFWVVVISFALVYVNYWTSMILQSMGINFRIMLPGFLLMGVILIFGFLSFLSIVKYKDKSILLILTSILGLIGLAFTLGELFFPH